MAAPTPTARQTPDAGRMSDGFSTKITFAAKPNVALWERQVKPPGLDGGEPIDISTMFNVFWHTLHPRRLVKMADATTMVAYNPVVLNELLSLLNVQTTITITFPDAATWCFYGFLQKFEPGDNKEGEFPEATVTVVPTNWDYVNKVEAGPVYTTGSGGTGS